MEATLPVRFTVNPSLISLEAPNRMAPTLSSSRFITIACIPLSNSSNSFVSAFRNPKIRITPSLTLTTTPVSLNWTRVSIPLSCIRSISETSLILIALSAIYFLIFHCSLFNQRVLDTLEFPGYARVPSEVIQLQDKPPDNSRVYFRLDLKFFPGNLLNPLYQFVFSSIIGRHRCN